jgi:tetratricopeptide (TPR) repeat protein
MKSLTTAKPPAHVGARNSALMVAIMAALAGCATTSAPHVATDQAAVARIAQSVTRTTATALAASIDSAKLGTAAKQLASEGIKALDAGDYSKASSLFNLGLKVEINNSYLHFLNALTYHYRALAGEGTLYEVAQRGYELAVQFDQSNATARFYHGLLHMDRRDFVSAQREFMEAAIYDADDAELLYALAVSSYYARDIRTAAAAVEGLKKLAVPSELRVKIAKTSAMIAAASGDAAVAKAHTENFKLLSADAADAVQLARRVDTWSELHQRAPMLPVQFTQPTSPPTSNNPVMGGPLTQPTQPSQPAAPNYPGAAGGTATPFPSATGSAGIARPGSGGGFAPSGAPRTASDFIDKNMVAVDVAIIGAEDDNGDTMGVNLLDGLKMQFGNSATPSWSRGSTSSLDRLTNAVTSSATTLSRAMSVSAVSYTLNIANARDRRNELLARPTLVALGGQTSQFFSGVDVLGAAVSSGQGGSVQVQKEVGVKLSVTPEFLPDDMIKLQVSAERTFLTNPNSNVVFDFRLDTTKTIVNANVVMKFGETIVLSGLSERDVERDNSGVPGLRDVPIAQYLFSKNQVREYSKSVLILLTPRRPSYTNRSEDAVKADRAKLNADQQASAEFEDKYRVWFKPVPNAALANSMLESTSVYREFRIGDVDLPNWRAEAAHASRMKRALSFMFF